ncbi:polymerase [Comamonadaceae bacterium OH2545_COT-014]|nr:polymerase [Comamonadaceae bacterium OH2545_COT-014]
MMAGLAGLLIVVSWLWPFTYGPTAATLPYLASATAGALLLALWPQRAPQGGAAVMAGGWLLAAALSAVVALLQYFNLEGPFFPWFNQARPGQAFGNLRQPNQLASLLVIGLLALGWCAQRQRTVRQAAPWLAALLLAALAATASRVGAVALLALAAMAGWWAWRAGQGRRALGWLGAGLALYAVAALALPWALQAGGGGAGRDLLERLQNAEGTCGSRLILWRNVLHLIGLRPWTGWGWGELDYAHYITLYDGPRFCHILDHAHNLPLHLAVELGVPVAVAACAALAWLVWRGRPWAERDSARQMAWGVLAVIGIHSLVEYPLWYGPFQIAALLCIGLLWCTRPRTQPAQADEEVPGGRRASCWRMARWAVALLVLAAVAYTGWDYRRVSQIYLPPEKRAAPYRMDAMAHARQSRLFAGVVRFAEVTTYPATRENASWLLPAALKTLHFSPEPRVAIKVIESATLLGQDALALQHLRRFKAAFPKAHALWREENQRMQGGAPRAEVPLLDAR